MIWGNVMAQYNEYMVEYVVEGGCGTILLDCGYLKKQVTLNARARG